MTYFQIHTVTMKCSIKWPLCEVSVIICYLIITFLKEQAVQLLFYSLWDPNMLYKCTCKRKSNQQNLGTIKYFNLCTEIVECYALDDEVAQVAVCNLVFIAVNMCQARQDLLLHGEGVAEDD